MSASFLDVQVYHPIPDLPASGKPLRYFSNQPRYVIAIWGLVAASLVGGVLWSGNDAQRFFAISVTLFYALRRYSKTTVFADRVEYSTLRSSWMIPFAKSIMVENRADLWLIGKDHSTIRIPHTLENYPEIRERLLSCFEPVEVPRSELWAWRRRLGD